MAYKLIWVQRAKDNLLEFAHAGDKHSSKKIAKLLLELEEHPAMGTGKPEQLRHEFAGL